MVLGSSFAPMMVLFWIIYRNRFFNYLQEEIKIESLLRLSKEDLAIIAQEAVLKQKAANVGLWDWDLRTNKIRYSKEWKSQIGYEDHEISNDYKEWENRVHPDDLEPTLLKVKKSIQEARQDHKVEYRFRKKDGSYGWILAQASVLVGNSGQPKRMIGSHIDITDQKSREEALFKANQEKEVLLREVHHRVKNNLSVIISLLNMQATRSDDPRIKEALKQSRDRVKSMGLVHKNLYQSESISELNLKDHTISIANNLLQTMREKSRNVRMIYEIDDINLSTDQAIPCGLILNELLTNALKYAFTNDRTGEIRISAHIIGDDVIELMVHDNGVGLPNSVNSIKPKSLGLYIVSILSQNQLSGALDIKNNNGACFVIRFPIGSNLKKGAF